MLAWRRNTFKIYIIVFLLAFYLLIKLSKKQNDTTSMSTDDDIEMIMEPPTLPPKAMVEFDSRDDFFSMKSKSSIEWVRRNYDNEFFMEIRRDLLDNSKYQEDVLDLLPFVSTKDKTKYDYDRVMIQFDAMYKLNKTLEAKRESLNPKLMYMNRNDPWDRMDFSDCPVTNCIATKDISKAKEADVIVYANTGKFPRTPELSRASQDQVWVMYINESPDRSWNMRKYNNFFNWTLTYMYNSVVTYPYFRFNFSEPSEKPATRNYAKGKTKSVAWFVSNCYFTKSGRMEYAKELGKYIDVDIFGRCGKLSCPSYKGENCQQLLNNTYKFYLSFENHKCKEYITEKASRPYKTDVVPIFLGARREDYERIMPKNSFIYADDFKSPKELAEYLRKVSKDESLYNKFFEYKSSTSKLLFLKKSKPWCRLCALVNMDNLPRMWYKDFHSYWKKDKCIGANKWT